MAESKWHFLSQGEELGLKVTPFLKDKMLVCKHKNEEGGLGIAFFKNAAHGGDWIVQPALSNDAFLTSILPEGAPLSTFRVITASRGGLPGESGVKVLSCVLRAGRTNAMTDHSCVMFNVDVRTGVIGTGLANSHWYQVGLRRALSCRWSPPPPFSSHPDNGKVYTGLEIPDFQQHVQACVEAHEKLCPAVPLSGWDLALTEEAGACLLEANLSCNFFRGSFDQQWYLRFMNEYLCYCEAEELASAARAAQQLRARSGSFHTLMFFGTSKEGPLEEQAREARQWKRRQSGVAEVSIG